MIKRLAGELVRGGRVCFRVGTADDRESTEAALRCQTSKFSDGEFVVRRVEAGDSFIEVELALV